MSNLIHTNSLLMLERAMNFQWTKQVTINERRDPQLQGQVCHL